MAKQFPLSPSDYDVPDYDAVYAAVDQQERTRVEQDRNERAIKPVVISVPKLGRFIPDTRPGPSLVKIAISKPQTVERQEGPRISKPVFKF